MDYFPKRIICLTEETTETLYLLGESDRIVGISGFTMRPRRARKEKPKVSTFLDANIEEIINLKPDLVIGFSDIQADIARELIIRGITVWVNNHRTVRGILNMMVQLGTLVNKKQEALELVERVQTIISHIESITSKWSGRPRVYFEEWYDPLISGIGWVSEIIHLAGGEDVFAMLGQQSLAKDRIIRDPAQVVRQNPDIILVSWCGKPFKKDRLISREGWSEIKAVVTDAVHELPADIILQPGPAALIEGLPMVHELFAAWYQNNSKKK